MLVQEAQDGTAVQELRVLVVDDDPEVLSAMGNLLQVHGFSPETFTCPEELLKVISPNDVGCLVTDLKMPSVDGLELQRRLNAMECCLSVVVVTAHADVPRTIEIMSQGAVTLLEKPFKALQLVAAVSKAVEVSQNTCERRQRVRHSKESIGRLTAEELEVMKLAAAGISNKLISEQLQLSPRTVDRRRRCAMEKLGVNSIADFAVMFATSQQQVM